jgi:TolB protein
MWFHRRNIIILSILLCFVTGCEDHHSIGEPCIDCGLKFDVIDSEPDWSPSGEWIVYCHADSELSKTGIYLIRPNGTENHIWHQGVVETPTWGPREQWIVFSENGQIWKKIINGDSLTCITSVGRNFYPSCSSTSNHIAYNQVNCTDYECGIWVTDRDASSNYPIAQYGMFPKFIPAHEEVTFLKRWVEKNGNVKGDSLFTINQDGSNKRFVVTLEDPNYQNECLNYNSSGSQLVFFSLSIHGEFSLWTMNSDGTKKTKVSSNAYNGDWNPEGNKIVFSDITPENGRLWIMNSDGSNKIQLTFKSQF